MKSVTNFFGENEKFFGSLSAEKKSTYFPKLTFHQLRSFQRIFSQKVCYRFHSKSSFSRTFKTFLRFQKALLYLSMGFEGVLQGLRTI